MMTINTLDTVRTYQDEMLREAEAQRLVNEALKDQPRTSPLTWVGRRMVALGNSLIEVAGEDADGTERRTTISMN
jgi:hypothetical protein